MVSKLADGGVVLYKKISVLITQKITEAGLIEESKRDIYTYGFEVLISTLCYLLIFLLVAFATNTVLCSFVFAVGFFIVRSIAGGYHADTYTKCHLLSLANQILFVILMNAIPNELYNIGALVLLLISAIMILILAPIAHPNKPFIKTERARFRLYSCLHSTILIVIAVLCYFLVLQPSSVLLSFAVGNFCAAFALMSAKIQTKKKEQKQ